jgi:WS/DGAT/MGAT family acyltransferase
MDAGFLYGETPEWHMHAGALIVLEPPDDPEWSAVDAMRAAMRASIDELGPFRHRPAFAPFGLAPPVWVDTPDLDLDAHIRAVAVPAPGGPRELGEIAGKLFETKLDRTRPLWEMWVLEGLEGGQVGVLVKIHHALVDGVRGARLYEVMFDLAPDTRPAPEQPRDVENEPLPSALTMWGHTALSLATTPLRVGRVGIDVARAAVGALRFVRGPDSGNMTLPFSAPRTTLNRPLSMRRSLAFSSVSLEDVKFVKQTFDVTVNDVALAMCGGALRQYLLDRGELPDRALVATIPVGVHRADSGSEGNFVASTGATLATDIEDPVERLLAINRATRAAKHLQSALGDDLIGHLLQAVPPFLLSAGMRLAQSLDLSGRMPPVFTSIVSNVPGPTVPLFSAGARLVATYTVGPLLMGSGMNITLLSYLDRVDFGVATCPDVVEDAWAIAEALPGALAELVKAANSAEVASRDAS